MADRPEINEREQENEEPVVNEDELLLDRGDDQPDQPDEVEARPEREDWKEKAIRAEERLRVLEEQRHQQAQAPAQPDPITTLEQQIRDAEANLPKLDSQRPDSFFEREEAKEKLIKLQNQLHEARTQQLQRSLYDQQSQVAVQGYKARFAGSAEFKAVERQFDTMVGQLEPHLRSNAAMLDMIRKNLEYDHMKAGRNRQGPGAPPQAPSGAYQPQASVQKGQKVNWRSDEDKRVGEYYISRGIISSVEEFYDPRLTERSESANKNGTSIYDMPEQPRGWRKG